MVTPRSRAVLSLVVFCLVVGAAGCAVRHRLPYPEATPRAGDAAGIVVVLEPVGDDRSDKTLDAILEKAPAEEVSAILAREISSLPGVGSVIAGNAEPPSGSHLVVTPSVRRLAWEMVAHDRAASTRLYVGVVSGVIGPLVHGATSIDVHGHAALAVVVRAVPPSDRRVLEKEYAATANARVARLKSDLPETKAEMAARALQQVIEQFKADLSSLVAPARVSSRP